MRKLGIFIATIAVVGIFSIILSTSSFAQSGYGRHPGMWMDDYQGHNGWSYCPYCGSHFGNWGRNQEMFNRHHQYDYNGRRGHHMGPGMMGHGYGYPNGYPESQRFFSRYEKPLKKQDAEKLVKDMLQESRNPNLKTGAVEEKEDFYVVSVLTKEGDVLVDKMKVDKESGMMRSIY